jgi:hypothetical protein
VCEQGIMYEQGIVCEQVIVCEQGIMTAWVDGCDVCVCLCVQWFCSSISKEMLQWNNFNIQVRLLYKWNTFFINLGLTREVDTLIN